MSDQTFTGITNDREPFVIIRTDTTVTVYIGVGMPPSHYTCATESEAIEMTERIIEHVRTPKRTRQKPHGSGRPAQHRRIATAESGHDPSSLRVGADRRRCALTVTGSGDERMPSSRIVAQRLRSGRPPWRADQLPPGERPNI
jgi:hypothetical protein